MALAPISVSISLGAGAINTQGFKVPLILIKLATGDYSITGVDTVAKEFTIDGDHSSEFAVDSVLRVYGSTGNDGAYTVASATTVAGPATEIVVDEVVPDATVDGGILVSDWADFYKLYGSQAEVDDDQAYFGVQADVDEIALPFSQTRRPDQIAVGVWGADHASVSDALTELLIHYSGFYAFTLKDATAADWVATPNTGTASAWAESNQRLLFIQDSDVLIPSDGAETSSTAYLIKNLSLEYSTCVYHPAVTEYVAWAAVAKWLSWDADQRAVGFAYTQLSGVTAYGSRIDGPYTTAEKTVMDAKYVSYYDQLGGVSCMSFSGQTGAGRWLDERLAADWAAARIEEAISQQFLDVAEQGQQIPFSDVGFSMISGTVRGVLARGERLPGGSSHFEPGSVSVAYTELADLAAADVTARRCQIQFTARPAGMTQQATITGTISLSVPA